MRDSKLEWLKFDTATLPEELSEKLESYRAAQEVADEIKREFVTAFIETANESGLAAPKGHEIIVSLKFKDVSMAYKPIEASKSKADRIGFSPKGKGSKRTLTPRKS